MLFRNYVWAACLASTVSVAAAQGPFLSTYRMGPAFSSGAPTGIAAGLEAQLNSPDYSGKTSGDALPVSLSVDVVYHSHFTNFPLLLNLRLDPRSMSLPTGPLFYELGIGAQWSTGDEGSGIRLAYGASVGLFVNSARSASIEVRYYGSGNNKSNSLAALIGFRS